MEDSQEPKTQVTIASNPIIRSSTDADMPPVIEAATVSTSIAAVPSSTTVPDENVKGPKPSSVNWQQPKSAGAMSASRLVAQVCHHPPPYSTYIVFERSVRIVFGIHAYFNLNPKLETVHLFWAYIVDICRAPIVNARVA